MLIATLTPGRGTLGGAVATATPHGARFHARAVRTQPRTASQTQVQARAHALAFAWRTLSPTQRAGWQTLASGAASGYNLFFACNSNLLAIGQPGILAPPGSRPAFPALSALTVTTLYNIPTPPNSVFAWQLDTMPALTAVTGVVARMTGLLSPTKANIRPSDLRIVATGNSCTTPLFIPRDSWFRVFGHVAGSGRITFELTLIDPLSGFAGPTLRASTAYSSLAPTETIEWDTQYLINGGLAAFIPNQVFEIEGEVVAGP